MTILDAARQKDTADGVRAVSRVIRGQPASDGAGVKLNRVIGTDRLPDLDPFLMLDEFRSDDPSAYIAGFPDHPHRGFETVTYMLAGRMRHGDNKGNKGLLGPGSVQWMTAGRGIVHSEMPEQEHGLMWGFQLWINLPAKDKMTAPRYQDIAADAIPQVAAGGGATVKVIAGGYDGVRGPVNPGQTEPIYLDVVLAEGGSFAAQVPTAHAGFVYVYDGAVEVGRQGAGRKLVCGEIGVLGAGGMVSAQAGDAGGKFLLLAGKPLGEPVVKYGPFVMNTPNEIRQAIVDFQAGRF